jgi:hypothetical protein
MTRRHGYFRSGPDVDLCLHFVSFVSKWGGSAIANFTTVVADYYFKRRLLLYFYISTVMA